VLTATDSWTQQGAEVCATTPGLEQLPPFTCSVNMLPLNFCA